jgi:hypothetical protein
VPQVIGGAQAFVVLELTRGPARVVARQVVFVPVLEPGSDQQGIGKDIQHDLSPFWAVMISFAMHRGMIRFNKAFQV